MSYLSNITKGRIPGAPVRLLIHGVGGVGKSTFATGADKALFIDADNRTGKVDVYARYVPSSWEDILGVLREVYNSTNDEYKHVVIDTLDHTQLLIHEYVCKKSGKKDISDFDWGDGYTLALAEWRRLVTALNSLQTKGIGSILVCHTAPRTVALPSGEQYEMLSLKLSGGAKTNPGPYIVEKMDLVGFARFDDIKINNKKNDTKQVITTGDRLLSFAHNPAWDSKKGISFADEIKLSWAEYQNALETEKQKRK